MRGDPAQHNAAQREQDDHEDDEMIGPGSYFRLADRIVSKCDQETILGQERVETRESR